MTAVQVPPSGLEARGRNVLVVSVVDDDESVRRAVERLIRSFGFTVVVFASAEEFLVSNHLYDTSCLILDVWMPRMNGLQLQAHLVRVGCRVPIIFITAHPDETLQAQAFQAGAVDFLQKPFSNDALLKAIRRAFRFFAVDGLPG